MCYREDHLEYPNTTCDARSQMELSRNNSLVARKRSLRVTSHPESASGSKLYSSQWKKANALCWRPDAAP